jgi:hypothetical protein
VVAAGGAGDQARDFAEQNRGRTVKRAGIACGNPRGLFFTRRQPQGRARGLVTILLKQNRCSPMRPGWS